MYLFYQNIDFRPDWYLLVFQIWIVSGSEMPWWVAWSSSRSKKYFTARGTGRLVLRITVNRSSTNFCRVPYRQQVTALVTRSVAATVLPPLSQPDLAPLSLRTEVGASGPYLHGEQSREVDLRYGLGPLSLPQTASSVFGQFRFLTGLNKMPHSDSTLICILQHGRLWGW